LRDLKQAGANSPPLRRRQYVQLVDPVRAEGDYADHRSMVASPPDLARPKHAFAKEPSILPERMKACQPRQCEIVCRSMNLRGLVHIGQFKPPQHANRYFAAAL
jgi:hypothetical protein